MAIIYNGTELHSINYNGTDVKQVWVCDTSDATCTKVWNKSVDITFSWDFTVPAASCTVNVFKANSSNTFPYELKFGSLVSMAAEAEQCFPEPWTDCIARVYQACNSTCSDVYIKYGHPICVCMSDQDVSLPISTTCVCAHIISSTPYVEYNKNTGSFDRDYCTCNLGSLINIDYSSTSTVSSNCCIYPFRDYTYTTNGYNLWYNVFSESPLAMGKSSSIEYCIYEEPFNIYFPVETSDEDATWYEWSRPYCMQRCSCFYIRPGYEQFTIVKLNINSTCSIDLCGQCGTCTVTVNL